MTGQLILVVGPSGAGKDSILRYAMARFAGDKRVVFPRRCINRTVDANAEDHESLETEAFDTLARQGHFALVWEAHGLKYGIRRDIDEQLQSGRIVAVNVSRTILGGIANSYPQAVAVEISAAVETRANRVIARGRESNADILQRITRQTPPIPTNLRSYVVENDGNLADAGKTFCDLVETFLQTRQN